LYGTGGGMEIIKKLLIEDIAVKSGGKIVI